jgi:hypothetical protein
MTEFLYIYRGRDTYASPEQMQKATEKFIAWVKNLATQGHLKSPGNPLEDAGMVIKGKQKVVTDGPYAEAKDIIAGYSIIEAKDIRQAAELAKDCPIYEGGGSVEVRPIRKLP